MLQELLKYVLSAKIVEYFELIEIKEDGEVLHLHLDEKNVPPSKYARLVLSANDLYLGIHDATGIWLFKGRAIQRN
jgi:hypothetical protein